MTRISLQAAALGKLNRVDLELVPGRYVVLSNEPAPLRALVALLAGREPPRSGRVLLDGKEPAASPETRAQIAAVFERESLPPAPTALEAVATALRLRGDSADTARQVLGDAGLSAHAETSPRHLDERETRSLALALSLSHPRAALLALHEPLTTSLPRQAVLDALDRHTARGAVVLTTTTSTADATLLGGEWLCLELGQLRAAPGPAPRLGAGPWQQVLVEVSDAQSLAQLLHTSALGLATELGSEPHQLKVTGPALDLTVGELVKLCRTHGIELWRVSAAVPPVEALLAARAGFARGAYEAARAAALGSVPTAVHGPPPGYA